ncbi:carboxypeptidase-like regulatory domain-containing protein [Pedobacter jejuensis]|uniref:Carboxypeptidase-like regulatory domain-containing protein n=1 Tax=Pedobacter jejuensis TaxID=1268550 RepID=A0A3N0BTX2_9SPHI|nr:carboxypeptidase-like regulatory domain-containing protein [Pedobacter jejuensis]RNL52504.1 carboxypeptidase-like regulatory domain-containing protein [Pedobacter jejuensis]
MRKQIILFAILFNIYSLSQAQIKLNGKVEELGNAKAIPFATVSFNGKPQTITNVDGEFTIEVQRFPLTVQVSSVGYEPSSLIIKENSENIVFKLAPSVVSLNEVVISSNPALSIIEAAFQKGYKNASTNYYAKAFIRQLSSFNEKYTAISETFFDAKYTNYAIMGWNPTQSRYSKSDQGITLSNFNFLSFSTVGYLSTSAFATPLSKNSTQVYDVKLEGYIESDGDQIAIINCTIKDDKHGPTIMYFVGKYYINTKTFDVIKVQGHVKNFTLNSKATVKFTISDCPIEVIYAPTALNGNYVLKYANLTINGKMRYAGILGGGTLKYNSQIFIDEEDQKLNQIAYKATSLESKDAEELKAVKYDPVFWMNNPIIKRTPVENSIIKDFENKKIIGNYFNK